MNATPVTVRVPPDQLSALDQWRTRQTDSPTRPEALRRLAERELTKMPRKPAHPWADNPELLVYGIRSVGDVWAKLCWDISQVEDLLLYQPTDIVSVPYAYPNVCMAAMALRDWYIDEAKRRAKEAGIRWTEADGFRTVRENVRWSRIADDVANTMKHRGYRSDGMTNGVVDLRVHFPPDLQREYSKVASDFDRALFSIRHNDRAIWNVIFRDNASGQEINCLELFRAWEEDWHRLLSKSGMLSD